MNDYVALLLEFCRAGFSCSFSEFARICSLRSCNANSCIRLRYAAMQQYAAIQRYFITDLAGCSSTADLCVSACQCHSDEASINASFVYSVVINCADEASVQGIPCDLPPNFLDTAWNQLALFVNLGAVINSQYQRQPSHSLQFLQHRCSAAAAGWTSLGAREQHQFAV